MTTSLGKRSATNGISDIAYKDEKAPVYTSTSQFVQGTKTYNDPQKFLSNVLCSGFYYGDGSHLTNLPIINDPSKLPLAGGQMSGPITSGGNLDLVSTTDMNIQSTSNGNINLLALNLNSYGFALPMCFDFGEVDRQYNYTSGGQAWEQIWQQDLYLPTQFFTEAPNSGYASRKWRIDFTINTWNNGSGNNSQDKATAYYIALEDQAGTFYYPVVINPQTPFCRHNNNSTWSGGGPNFEFQPFSWTDIVDLQGISGSYGNLLPLRFKVYYAADNPKDFHFSYILGLTRTNTI